MADAIAQELRLAVGLVLHPGQAGRRQRVAQRRAPDLDQRADDRAAHGRDRGEPADAGAGQHAHQHRLGLVVGGVAERDAGGAEARRPRLQRPVARRARGRLHRAGADLHALDVHRNAQSRPERAHELGVARRAWTQVVIDVQDAQRQPPGRRQLAQQVQQGDGVRAAGDGHQDRFAAGEHRVAADRALDRVGQPHASLPADPPRPRRPRSAPSSRRGRCA